MGQEGRPTIRDRVVQTAAKPLAPMLVLVISVASLLWDRQAVRSEFLSRLGVLLGWDGAETVRQLLLSAREHWSAATAIGLGAFLVGSTVAFAQLQDALNRIWGVAPKPGKTVRLFIKKRLLSFAMVLGIGLLLMLSLGVNSTLVAAAHAASNYLWVPSRAVRMTSFVTFFVLITVLFATIYKVLPDVRITWRDVWVGAAVTSLLFLIGTSMIGVYVGRSALGSIYGAAGSFVILLLWVYYSAQVFFLGAEFTEVYALKSGRRIEPDRNATWVPKARSTGPTPGAPAPRVS